MKVPATWRAAILSWPCPTCSALPGQPCRTIRTGTPTKDTHVDRAMFAPRCPRCGSRIDVDSVAGDLCPRCALVRSLEVERSTHYQRRT